MIIGIVLLIFFINISAFENTTSHSVQVKGEQNHCDETQEGFCIQKILITKSKRIAKINGIFYAVGDMTAEGELVAVFKDRIVLLTDGQMRVVFMQTKK